MARRSWGTDSGSLASKKVVDISAYRRMRNLGGAKTVLYINDQARWSGLLAEISQLRVIEIQSMEALSERLLTGTHELILLESELGWADPVRLAKTLSSFSETPIVLICQADRSRKTASLVKRAYAAGVSDTLYAPLRVDELLETMDVLLKFQIAQEL